MCFQHNTALCCNTGNLTYKAQKPTDKKLDRMGGKGQEGVETVVCLQRSTEGSRYKAFASPPDSERRAIKPRHRAPLDPRAAYCDHSRLSSSLRHNERRLFLIGHA